LVCHCRATFDISSEYNFDDDDADDDQNIDREASGAGMQRDNETALDSHQQSLSERHTSYNIQAQSYAPVGAVSAHLSLFTANFNDIAVIVISLLGKGEGKE